VGIQCSKCQTDNPDTLKFCGECGTRLLSPEEIAVTETIEIPKGELIRGNIIANRYEIIEELGQGGMGRVYRVEDKKIKAEIALKLIRPEISSDKKTIERFSNELKHDPDDIPQECLPHVRPWRRQGDPLHHDGIRGRAGP
jgi:hypothetical protein